MSITDMFGGSKNPKPSMRPSEDQLPWILGGFQVMAQPHDDAHDHAHDHDHAHGEGCCGHDHGAGGEHHMHEVAFCLRIMGDEPQFLSTITTHPGESAEPALMTALRAALFEPMIPNAPRPPMVLVASETDRKRLEMAGGTYGLTVLVEPGMTALVEEMRQQFTQMEEDGLPDLALLAPVPDGVEMDAGFATDYLMAVREFWSAKPWQGMINTDLLQLTLPEGEERIACIMGDGGEEFGMLLFKTKEDFETFSLASSANMLREMKQMMETQSDPSQIAQVNEMLNNLPDELRQMFENTVENPPPMPEVIGLNFNPPNQAPPAMEEYLRTLAPAWLKEKLWPMVLKYGEDFMARDHVELELISHKEFSLVRDAALAVTSFCQTARSMSAWPPLDGYTAKMSVGKGEATVQFMASDEVM